METDKIALLLKDAREAYYNTGEPVMSDAEYDALEEELFRLDPQNPFFSTVGTEASLGKKIVHKYPMLSMGKAKNMEDVRKWLNRLALPEDTEYCLQPKIDGLSASCFYSGGKLKYTATRGDGKTGQDVSHIAEYLSDIKKTIGFSLSDTEIRGELYLPKNTAYDTGGRPLRNNCVGLINRKESREDLRYVRFVCYQIIMENSPRYETDKIALLKKEGFHTVVYQKINSPGLLERAYNEYIDKFREEWLYETDGLILTVNDTSLHSEIDDRWVVEHHHHYNLAIKPPVSGQKTPLLTVEWQVSRQGNLVPVAVFKPVVMGGATLERATLHNYRFARSLLLRAGDPIIVERANDVIPYIKENTMTGERNPETFTQTLLPEECPVCGSGLKEEGVHLRCSNSKCPEKIIQEILYWVRQSGIENVAEATVRVLFDKGKIKNVKDLYTLKYEDFSDVEGFADKKIDNFLSQVAASRNMTAVELISKLGIPLVQQKSLKKLGIETMFDFYSFNDSSYVIGRNIIDWKEDSENMEFLKELLEVIEISDPAFQGETAGYICMTGKGPYPRQEMEKRLSEKGYQFTDTVTGETTLLLCDDPSGTSGKLKSARKKGIPVLTYFDFFERL